MYLREAKKAKASVCVEVIRDRIDGLISLAKRSACFPR